LVGNLSEQVEVGIARLVPSAGEHSPETRRRSPIDSD
jgi:hypothetical protein